VSLDGAIHYLDRNSGKESRTLRGHNKFVKALGYNNKDKTIYSAAYDGHVVRWTEGEGNPESISGAGHTNEVSAIVVEEDSSRVITSSMDDTFRIIDHSKKSQSGTVVKLDGPIADLSIPAHTSHGTFVAVTHQSVCLMRDDKLAHSEKVSYKPISCDISPDCLEIAVGGDDNKVHIFKVEGNTFKEETTLAQHRGAVGIVRYSPNGKMLASGDSNREVIVWDRTSRKSIVEGWQMHNARVVTLAWSPESDFLATGSLDQSIILWSLSKQTERVHLKGAHYLGVNKVFFASQTLLLSVGQDNTVKSWTIVHP